MSATAPHKTTRHPDAHNLALGWDETDVDDLPHWDSIREDVREWAKDIALDGVLTTNHYPQNGGVESTDWDFGDDVLVTQIATGQDLDSIEAPEDVEFEIHDGGECIGINVSLSVVDRDGASLLIAEVA